MAATDTSGARLVTRCDYAITGRGPSSLWWSLSAYDAAGQLFENSAQRYAFNATTLMRGADGTFTVTVSREARAGNWLPVAGDGDFKLMLSVYGLENTQAGRGADETGLPVIRKESCR